VFGDGCLVRQPFVTNLSAVEVKLAEMHDLALKNYSQCHSGLLQKTGPKKTHPVFLKAHLKKQ